MSDAAQIIRDIVFEHAWVSNTDRLASYGKCECGHETAQDCDWYPYDMGNHAQHVADTILAALSKSHVVVDMPTGIDADDALEEYGLTIEPPSGLTTFGMPITLTNDETGSQHWMSAKEARNQAAAFLVAARVAEGGASDE